MSYLKSKKPFPFLFFLILLLMGVSLFCLSCEEKEGEMITSEKAKEKILSYLKKYNFYEMEGYQEALKNSELSTPYLVTRLDEEKKPYYIFPFRRDEMATLVVIVDAVSGDFMEAAYFKEPEKYLKIEEEETKEIFLEKIKKAELKEKIRTSPLRLVWMVCEETQSPFEPLWEFSSDGSKWYVDQKGNFMDKLTPIEIKGGGA